MTGIPYEGNKYLSIQQYLCLNPPLFNISHQIYIAAVVTLDIIEQLKKTLKKRQIRKRL